MSTVTASEVLCSVCLRLVVEDEQPVQFACGHFACQACCDNRAARHVSKMVLQDVPAEEQEKNLPKVVCGFCGKSNTYPDECAPFDGDLGMKTDIFCDQHKVVCVAQGCGKDGAFWCERCGVLCAECSGKIHGLLKHDLVELKGSWRIGDEADAGVCKKHQLPFMFLCDKCIVPLCQKCAVEKEHGSHDVCEFNPARIGDAVKSSIGDVVKMRDVIQSAQSMTAKDNVLDKKEEVHRIFEKAHTILKEQEAAICKKMDEYAEEVEEYDAPKSEAKELLKVECQNYEYVLGNVVSMGNNPLIFDTIRQTREFLSDCRSLSGKIDVASGVTIRDLTEKMLSPCTVTFRKLGDKRYVQYNADFSKATVRESTVKTGFTSTNGCAACFDPVRRIVIECSSNESDGRDFFVTTDFRNGEGTNSKKSRLLPFEIYVSPTYDGGDYLYVTENRGKGFLRVHVETLEIERLPQPPESFSCHVYPVYVDGLLYAVGRNSDHMLCYNVEMKEWKKLDYSCEEDSYKCHYDRHPWDSSLFVQFRVNGTIAVIKREDGSLVHTYNARYDNWNNVPETLVIAAPDGEFYAIACNGEGGNPWRVFSSKEDKWTQMTWPSVAKFSRTAFFDEETRELYYHIRGKDTWTIVTLPE